MLDKMTNRLDFHGNALLLRAERQRAIASNIANADTPGYVARDFSFADAMREATGASSGVTRMATDYVRVYHRLIADTRRLTIVAGAE